MLNQPFARVASRRGLVQRRLAKLRRMKAQVVLDEGLDEVWKLVRVPVMTLENSAGETIRVMVVPCATHMPNWYVAVNSFRVKAMAFMEEANIHIETISTMGYANVFPEDPSEEEEEG